MTVADASKGILSHEETIELIKLAQEGDKEARSIWWKVI